jgi:alkylation response protein AidB-like acyl-CoA dehydrogenase
MSLLESLQTRIETVVQAAEANALSVDGGSFPSATLEAARQQGLLGLVSSIEVGGLGGGLLEASALVERLARVCGSSAMVVSMHFAATAVIEAHGPRELRSAIAAGKHLSTLAFSEFGSRSHFWAPVSTATAQAGEIVLNAKKSWVTSARHADSYVWSSKPSEGSELSSLWLVPRATAGVSVVGANFDGLGFRGNDSSPIVAEAAKIPASARLGEEGAGFGIMMGVVLPSFSVLNASASAGLMEGATSKTAAHVGSTRFEHAGSSLADLPTIRAYVARMRIKTDQVKALIDDTIRALSSGRADAQLRVLECKAAAGDAAIEVTDLAMRVSGGAAFRKEVAVERYFRDARAAAVMGPTSDVLYDFIGKAVCGMPLF